MLAADWPRAVPGQSGSLMGEQPFKAAIQFPFVLLCDLCERNAAYSTVTLLAKLRGLSTSHPSLTAR